MEGSKQVGNAVHSPAPRKRIIQKEHEQVNCFNCQNGSICYLRRDAEKFVKEAHLLSDGGDNRAATRGDVLILVANACLRFIPIELKP